MKPSGPVQTCNGTALPYLKEALPLFLVTGQMNPAIAISLHFFYKYFNIISIYFYA
jgi:hypothetical protein